MFDKAHPFSLDIRLHIDTRESKLSWATLAELQTVIPYHSQRVMEECKKRDVITANDLTFTTRFVAVFMLIC